MKKYELQSILQTGPEPKRLKETQQICTAILNQQKQLDQIPEERTRFWQFLSDVMPHIGWRLWVSQGIVLLFICAGVFSIHNMPNVISMFIPLLILACLPSFYQSSTFGMAEMEAVTRASGAQIILAKLLLAGAAQIVCLTVICWLAIVVADYPVTLIQLIMYTIVPFLACLILALWNMRTRERYAIQFSVISCLGVSAFAGVLTHWFPAIYDISAIGVWFITFVLFMGFFTKELSLLIKTWKEGKMYGIIA